MTTVYTIGHSTKPIEVFIGLLQGAGIKHLVDVRSRPFSRFNPQFNKNALSASLEAAGIEYYWKGNQLGGLDGNVDFEGGIETVLDLATFEPTVVMCSEGPTTKCHRRYMLTPEFQKRGAIVEDISQTGEVTKAAVVAAPRDTPSSEALF
jgi:uncharacterized protein (DUF488 family)